ncbi:MAG: uracil-DNA glycosylase [Mangrovibacterium sp.]
MESLAELLPADWQELLHDELQKEYFNSLSKFVEQEYAEQVVFPSKELIFRALHLCPVEKIKVVILGQDPYHGEGEAHGLCFSVARGKKIPPSLRNIFKELNADVDFQIPLSGDLTSWANQGVLLLNATLTVRKDFAGSHQKKGWENFTDALIQTINKHADHVVFLLWGNYAMQKAAFIDVERHVVFSSVHPSPLSASRGFFGNHHFSKTNQYLESMSKTPINWSLKEPDLFS